jgi:hypothetical protein
MATLAVLYEHPEWFRPLFAELERRGIPYEKLDAGELGFSPGTVDPPPLLVFNRMSPSAYLRGRAHAIFATLHYLAYLEEVGVPTINGRSAFQLEISKTAQLTLLQRLGLRYPRARVINHPALAAKAAQGLNFPVVVKPNIGGSGAGIRCFADREALEAAAASEDIDLGIDRTALVQEQLPAAGGHIVRVEVLNGELLYAIRLFPKPGSGFNLCPADICQEGSSADFCPQDAAPKKGMRVEGYRPPAKVVEDVLRIARAGKLDVGGVEYLVNERDGEVYYYDINALSNFVTDAPNVVGFDPFVNLVDYLAARLGAGVAALRS